MGDEARRTGRREGPRKTPITITDGNKQESKQASKQEQEGGGRRGDIEGARARHYKSVHAAL
ncbi:hypothetical protein E2C01_051413 [Portunus trituberculatus]|uniref:Uncharacterized protein n=1 Tax=Portunus trituberculatus TaxID=210409 RepID=A0A5B7GJ14_PORTR|nr:hypothetical protein [Portunus trituberculatus]